MNCSSLGSSVHGILQARILEWVAVPHPRDLSNPEIKPGSLALQADYLPLSHVGSPPGPPGKSQVLSLKSAISLSSFILKRLFSSSSLSAMRMVSSAYLRLLIFSPTILIPAYVSSSLAFHMMHSACKLNKQGDNIQPWRTPFPMRNQSVISCPVLSVPSCPADRFLKRQVRWSGIDNKIWYIYSAYCILNKSI